jgi:hypothetical protein
MFRSIPRTIIPLVAVLLSVAAAAPAQAASVIDIVHADRMQRGATVRITVDVTCDPIGAGSQAFFSLTLWQGTYPRRNYVEGSGSFGVVGGDSLACDRTPHTYRVTVHPSSFYADRRFRVGRAWTESVVQVCTFVGSDGSCRPVGDLVRQRTRIHR